MAEADKLRSTPGSSRTTGAAAVALPRRGGNKSLPRAHDQSNETNDFKQRLHWQRKQVQRDCDWKIKEAVQRGSLWHGDSRQEDNDNELQKCQSRQREQAESDWRVKEGNQEQMVAAGALWGAAPAGGSTPRAT